MELGGRASRRAARGQPDLRRAGRLSGYRSAPLPDLGPRGHLRGPEAAPLVVVYADFECPYCAALELRLRGADARVCFRHFPVRSKHPRAWAAAGAAEAAALQGAFWPMHDALFADQGRLEDPHLWARAERLGLDLGRFDADRRSERVRERIHADFRGGIRAGVASTPAIFAFGGRIDGRPDQEFWDRLRAAAR